MNQYSFPTILLDNYNLRRKYQLSITEQNRIEVPNCMTVNMQFLVASAYPRIESSEVASSHIEYQEMRRTNGQHHNHNHYPFILEHSFAPEGG
jgi:hypothetical protein